MSNLEKAIIQILKKLNLDKESVIVIMLQLKGNKRGQNSLMKYLRDSNPNDLTQTNIFDKVMEITQAN